MAIVELEEGTNSSNGKNCQACDQRWTKDCFLHTLCHCQNLKQEELRKVEEGNCRL